MGAQETQAIIGALFGCGQAAAEELSRIASVRSDHGDSVLLHQGSTTAQSSFILSGSADLRLLGADGKTFQMATVEVGEPFGAYPCAAEIAVDVITRQVTEVLSFDAPLLAAHATRHADLGAALAEKFARQSQDLLGRFAVRLTLSAVGRVCEQLLQAADAERRISPVPVVAALAVQAQTTRETASRAISALERRGIVVRHDAHWEITSPRLLEDYLT